MAEKVVGGLKWVKGEIAVTLRRVTGLVDAYRQTDEPASLGDAADALFEVRGVLLALQIGLPARLVDEMQRLCDAMGGRRVRSPKEAAEALMLALIQLPNHLDQLDAATDLPPLSLWPIINDLRESRGAPPLTAAELLVPGSVLAEEEEDLPPEALEALTAVFRKVRPHFHRDLVSWYRPATSNDGIIKLGQLFHQLHRYLKDGILADLFRLAEVYAEGLQSGDVDGGPPAQALVGRLDRVFKPLVRSPPEWPDVDAHQLIDAFLAELATAAIQNPVVAEIQAHYGPARLAPSAGASAALAGLAATMLGEFGALKERLDLFVRGEREDRTPLDEIRAVVRNLARTLEVVDAGGLAERLRTLADGFGELAMADAAEDVLRLEPLAGELLAIEVVLHAYAEHRRPPVGGINAPGIHAAELQSATLREARAECVHVKDVFVECQPQGARPAAFREVPERLSSVAGALQILGDDSAAQVVHEIADLVRRRYLATDRWPRETELERLADAVAAVDLRLERVEEGEPADDGLTQQARAAVRALDQLFDPVESADHWFETQSGGARTPLAAAPAIEELPSRPHPNPSAARPMTDHVSLFAADDELLEIFCTETLEHLEALHAFLRRAATGSAVPDDATVRALHTLSGSARMAGVDSIADVASALERCLQQRQAASVGVELTLLNLMDRVADAIAQRSAEIPAVGAAAAELAALAAEVALIADADQPARPAVADDSSGLDLILQDSDLVDFFGPSADREVGEGVDFAPFGDDEAVLFADDLPELGAVAGARLAAADAIDLLVDSRAQRFADDLPVLVAAPPSEDLAKVAVDALALELQAALNVLDAESVNAPGALVVHPAVALASVTPEPEPVLGTGVGGTQVDLATAGAGTPAAQVRVRCDVLSQFVHDAGEIGLYRARLSQRNGLLGASLGELDQTVRRLHDQLRQLEIETEAQIRYRGEREQPPGAVGASNPLALDRFSTIQQISRGLAESGNDLLGLRDLLSDYQREFADLLTQQARHAAHLQGGLLRARMVPFGRVISRLRRLVRQTADRLGKAARLEVTGLEVELDCSILDRLVAPLEHLLRYAVDHGLETPPARAAAGKPATGTVTLAVEREGNDVLLTLSDDGRGLDLAAIRAHAVARGHALRRRGHGGGCADGVRLRARFHHSGAGDPDRWARGGVGRGRRGHQGGPRGHRVGVATGTRHPFQSSVTAHHGDPGRLTGRRRRPDVCGIPGHCGGCSADRPGGLLGVMGDGLVGEEIILQFLVEHRVLAADPFQHHGRVFLLLIAIVRQDVAQIRVLAGIHPLVVPIHRLQFLHQGDDGAVHVLGLIG